MTDYPGKLTLKELEELQPGSGPAEPKPTQEDADRLTAELEAEVQTYGFEMWWGDKVLIARLLNKGLYAQARTLLSDISLLVEPESKIYNQCLGMLFVLEVMVNKIQQPTKRGKGNK